jgi:hypothetical protein
MAGIVCLQHTHSAGRERMFVYECPRALVRRLTALGPFFECSAGKRETAASSQWSRTGQGMRRTLALRTRTRLRLHSRSLSFPPLRRSLSWPCARRSLFDLRRQANAVTGCPVKSACLFACLNGRCHYTRQSHRRMSMRAKYALAAVVLIVRSVAVLRPHERQTQTGL